MVDAAQCAAIEIAVAQVGQPVRTVPLDQRRLRVGVAEEHEIFAEQTDRQRLRAEFLRERRRLPIAAHQFATRRTGIGVGYEPVLFFRQHVIIVKVFFSFVH